MRRLFLAILVSFAVFVTPALSSPLRVKVDISQQKMYVTKGNKTLHVWKVSTGKKGYRTPTGSYEPTRMYRKYFSKKYHGSPMPHSIFFRGGYAIHGTGSTRRLGAPASHGCVRLHPDHARALYNLVKKYGAGNTSIRIQT